MARPESKARVMTIAGPVYATRESVKRALDIKETARVNGQVDRLLQASTESINGYLHRTFYPRLMSLRVESWDTWLNDNELVSVSSVTYDGIAVSVDDYVLTPSGGPPYNRLRIGTDLRGREGLVGGTILITGTFGHTLDLKSVGALSAGMNSSATSLTVGNGSLVGVGDLLYIDLEYMLVTGRSWLDSGQDLQASLDANAASTSVSVSDGSLFNVGETILIDNEILLIVDVAGNNLITKRAWDGSVLSAHVSSDVYVNRSVTVERGMVGSVPAGHLIGTAINRWAPPFLITQLCVAETLTGIEQEQSAYARVVGSGDSAAEGRGLGLADLRDRAITAYGRKCRMRSV